MAVQAWDFIFLAVLIASCLSGVMRGGIKELVNLISFFLALFIAVVSHPFVTKTFALDMLMGVFVAFLLFLLIYFGIRFFGHSLAEKVHKQKALNAFDRALGLGIGIFRTLVVLGVIHLIFVVVTPKERLPEWFLDAKVFPLTARCAEAIQAFVPVGSNATDKVVETSQE
ncbi:colicin V production family protein [Asticcacaulis biprosthecium C19]|uniref:Colicin V production family protein n=1 Tax=Asticcacaulis biprosthecium C19 TaxID=715226 RepID=F4QRF3_9CAUL|nr:colicin V production family protein [Asticcacaulis biprosthecium C19]